MTTETIQIINDMSLDEYHAAEGLSNSGIGYLLKCPYKYWHLYLNSNFVAKAETSSLRFGKLLHKMLLEENDFENAYYVTERIRRDPRSQKWKEVESVAESRDIIFIDEYEKISQIKQTILQNPNIHYLLQSGTAEQSIFWTDEKTGVRCKIRPDYYNPLCICDLKTTVDASPQAFQKSLFTYGYYRQAAMYLDGLRATVNINHDSFVFIAVEKEPPYLTGIYMLSDDDIEQGRREYQRGLEIYRECSDKNHWPGYGDTIQTLTLPHWAFDDERRELRYGTL